MSWSEYPQLRGQPEVVQDIFKTIEKKFVADKFLPDRMVGKLEAKWRYRRDLRILAPMLSENQAAPITKPRYEVRMATMEFTRQAVTVSRYLREHTEIANYYQDAIEVAANAIARRIEVDKITAMKNSVDTSDTDYKGIYYKDCDDDDSQWVNGGSNTDITADITNAIDQIYDATTYRPDTMIVPPFVASELRRTYAILGWDKWGPLAPQVMQSGQLPGARPDDGYLGQLHGVQVYEVAARYQIDEDDLTSPFTLALGNDVLIFKAGSIFGEGLFYHKIEDIVEERPRFNETIHQAGVAWIPAVYNELGFLIQNAVA